MSSSRLRARIAVLHAEASAVGAALAERAAGMDAEELFEVTGDLQGVSNAVDGAQLVAIAHAASHETRLTGRGPVEVHHGLGFVDAMTSTEVSLATGVGQWVAGRRVGLAAALSSRFPRLLARVVGGQLAGVNAAKVVTACDGLDQAACAAVEGLLLDRLTGLDPARITTVTRRIAIRVAADQVSAATAKNRRDRCVQVSPGPDGTTDWWARLPAAASAAAWAAVRDLADDYAKKDPALTLDQSRADALIDLLLTNVSVTTHLTLGIPVLTGPDAHTARDAAIAEYTAPDPTSGDTEGATGAHAAVTTDGPVQDGAGTTAPTCPATADVADPARVRPVTATGGLDLGPDFSLSAAVISGCEIPGVGFIDADTVEALLNVVPTDLGRALLDARTGTLMESVSSAYRPSKALTEFVTTRDGTCRMWGCPRPATACDIDHARPWPNGPTTPTNLAGLCRRHHRLKQRRRWTYQLAPDGTATWTSPSGTKRITPPDHAALPPPPQPQVTPTAPPGRRHPDSAPPPF